MDLILWNLRINTFEEDDELVLDQWEAIGFDPIGIDALLLACSDILQIEQGTIG